MVNMRMCWHEDKYLQEKSKRLPPTEVWQSIVRVKMACTFWRSIEGPTRASAAHWGAVEFYCWCKKTNQGLWTQDLIRVKSFLQIFLPTSQVQGSETPLRVECGSCHTVYPNEWKALIGHLKIHTWRMVWETVNQEASFTRGKYKYTCHSQ